MKAINIQKITINESGSMDALGVGWGMQASIPTPPLTAPFSWFYKRYVVIVFLFISCNQEHAYAFHVSIAFRYCHLLNGLPGRWL